MSSAVGGVGVFSGWTFYPPLSTVMQLPYVLLSMVLVATLSPVLVEYSTVDCSSSYCSMLLVLSGTYYRGVY